MEGLELLEPTSLFNLLNQGTKYPMLSNPCYLLLLDVRSTSNFTESHILTAKLVKKEEDGSFHLPIDTELETKQNIVIYDNQTSTLSAKDAPAVAYGQVLWQNGSKYPVKILKGGYETFSALYPFLRTQNMLYTPRELDEIFTYPVEVIPGFLYSGTCDQSQRAGVNKDLKIKAHINVTKNRSIFFQDDGSNTVLQISIEDNKNEHILKFFKDICSFIDAKNNKDRKSVLIFSDLGISRSIAASMAYLMHHHQWTLKAAWKHVKNCKQNACPNMGFVRQLAVWEEQLLGGKFTDVDSLYE
eukprot:gene14281-15768_t